MEFSEIKKMAEEAGGILCRDCTEQDCSSCDFQEIAWTLSEIRQKMTVHSCICGCHKPSEHEKLTCPVNRAERTRERIVKVLEEGEPGETFRVANLMGVEIN